MEPKVTVILEVKDLNKLKINKLIRSFNTHDTLKGPDEEGKLKKYSMLKVFCRKAEVKKMKKSITKIKRTQC